MSVAFGIDAVGPNRLLARGELSFATAEQALPAGLSLLPSGGACTMDLTAITSADSAGLAVLIEWLSVAAERGCKLVFEAVPAQLRAIARISDLDELIAGQSANGPGSTGESASGSGSGSGSGPGSSSNSSSNSSSGS